MLGSIQGNVRQSEEEVYMKECKEMYWGTYLEIYMGIYSMICLEVP